MNLSATLSVYGGGQGSGCSGPNCGRPPGALKMPRGRQSLERIDKELRDAGQNLKVVLMEYKSADSDPDDTAKSYVVEPYSYRNGGKTFFGFDQVAKQIKAFKVENIVSVGATSQSFKARWPVELKPE